MLNKNIIIFLSVYLSTGCTPAHKGTRSTTQTLQFENYLSKAIPVSINIQATVDKNTNLCDKVCLSFQDTKDQIIITTKEDYYSEDSKDGTKKKVFREPAERAYYISEFEAQQIDKGCGVLIRVLEEFDKCLQEERWEECQGLDSYLMRFLRGFNFLICSATNNTISLFSAKYKPDSVYDISIDIRKLNKRVNYWRIDSESKSKLQTVTKELLYQCRIWERSLQQKTDGQENLINDGLLQAMDIFIRIYLCNTRAAEKLN